jgi:hypothetical protein
LLGLQSKNHVYSSNMCVACKRWKWFWLLAAVGRTCIVQTEILLS